MFRIPTRVETKVHCMVTLSQMGEAWRKAPAHRRGINRRHSSECLSRQVASTSPAFAEDLSVHRLPLLRKCRQRGKICWVARGHPHSRKKQLLNHYLVLGTNWPDLNGTICTLQRKLVSSKKATDWTLFPLSGQNALTLQGHGNDNMLVVKYSMVIIGTLL